MQIGCIWSHNASLHHCGVSEMPICRWLLVGCVLSNAIIAESPDMEFARAVERGLANKRARERAGVKEADQRDAPMPYI